ncbi:MAG: MFS transporter [Cyanobacteria bacterium HKST-UBA06]|nr:MFS transporter [Cyanobacteria bacterium HKST-UBA06]
MTIQLDRLPFAYALPTRSLFTRDFVLVCAATFCFFFCHHLLTPVFTAYLEQHHWHGQVLGAMLAALMVASLVTRPFVGKQADEWDKRRLLIGGALLVMLCPVLYTVSAHPAVMLPIRLVHGIGFAMFYVAASSYLADLVPQAHRGEGISYFSNAMKLATAISPALGVLLLNGHWMQPVFWLASAMAFVALLLVLQLRPVQPPLPSSDSALPAARNKGRLFNRPAFYPGLIMATNSMVFGVLMPFMPLIAGEKQLSAIFLFYPVYALSLMLSRGATGPLSDRYGRVSVIVPGMTLVIVSLWGLAAANHPVWFLGFSALYGFGAGTVQPSLIAMAVDRSREDERGSAMATFTMCNDTGIALGMYAMGAVGAQVGYSEALGLTSLVVLAGWLVFVWRERQGVLAWAKAMLSTGTVCSASPCPDSNKGGIKQ